MRVIAVPVKPLERAKGRLAAVLEPLERAALTLAMLEDVLDACLAVPGWQTWVVSPDEAVLEVSGRRARPIAEEDPGLLAAIRQVEEEAAGADVLAVVLGDLPLLTAPALELALHTPGPVRHGFVPQTPRGGRGPRRAVLLGGGAGDGLRPRPAGGHPPAA